MKYFAHPDDCARCKNTLVEMLSQLEADGHTVGVRRCPHLVAVDLDAQQMHPADVPQIPEDGLCPRKHLLPGMDNKTLNSGGIQCELKHAHQGICRITIEQATKSVKLNVDPRGEERPQVVSETPK